MGLLLHRADKGSHSRSTGINPSKSLTVTFDKNGVVKAYSISGSLGRGGGNMMLMQLTTAVVGLAVLTGGIRWESG